MENITANQILNALPSLSFEELRQVNNRAYELVQRKKTAKARMQRVILRAGMAVEWRNQGLRETGKIVKVKRTKAIVHRDGDPTGPFEKNWDIPLAMLTPIKEGG